MKYSFTFFMVLQTFSNGAFALEEKKVCAAEAAQKLLAQAAQMIGVIGAKENKVTKLFSEPEYAKSNLAKVKSQYFAILKEVQAKSGQIAGEMEALLAQNPQCDPNFLFRLKNK